FTMMFCRYLIVILDSPVLLWFIILLSLLVVLLTFILTFVPIYIYVLYCTSYNRPLS
ncbi:hypothetical protein L9F63_014962, partial [Diploptera punctata]